MNDGQQKIVDSFRTFIEADEMLDILKSFEAFAAAVEVKSEKPLDRFYEMAAKTKGLYFKLDELIDILKMKLNSSEYTESRGIKARRVLVVGGGPGGLRSAIEMAIMGCDAVKLIEKRSTFSRHNVLHLWPFSVSDIKSLGGKVMFSKFSVGCLDHISIRRVQIVFLKIVLILGVEVAQQEYTEAKSLGNGYYGFSGDPDCFEFNILLGCDGENSRVAKQYNFERKTLNFGRAIGITANFVKEQNHKVSDGKMGGRISYLHKAFFKHLKDDHNIDLENLVFYDDETLYTVMTVKKHTLLAWNIVKQDFDDSDQLLKGENVDRQRLAVFVRVVAHEQGIPDTCDYVTVGKERDLSIFDFTSKAAATSPSKYVEEGSSQLFVALIGDSLIAPFWPLGTGLAHACLSALDCAWVICMLGDPKQWKDRAQDALKEHAETLSKLEASSSETMFQRDIYPLDPKQRYKTHRYSL